MRGWQIVSSMLHQLFWELFQKIPKYKMLKYLRLPLHTLSRTPEESEPQHRLHLRYEIGYLK